MLESIPKADELTANNTKVRGVENFINRTTQKANLNEYNNLGLADFTLNLYMMFNV